MSQSDTPHAERRSSALSRRSTIAWLMVFLFALSGLTGAGILAAEKPMGSVTGVVLDDHHQPIPGARVHFMGQTPRTAQTLEDGTFRMDHLPVGRYNVQARARGYESQWSSPPILVEEAKTVEDMRFALSPRAPSLSFSQVQRVFTPQEKVRIGLRGTLIDHLKLKLYRIDVDRLANNAKDFRSLNDAKPEDLGDKATLIQEWERPIRRLASDEDDWFYRGIEVPEALGKGTYMLAVDGESDLKRPGIASTDRDSYWFEVTNLSLVAKCSSDRVLVYAVDLVTKKPLPNVQVRALDDQGVRWSDRTGPDGLLNHPYASTGTLMLLGKQGEAPAHVQSYFYASASSYNVQLFTERPIYRPGQEVFYKAIVRRERFGANTLVPNLPVTIQVMDPQDNVVHEQSLRLNDLGALDGSLTLGEEPPLGSYRLVALVDRGRQETTFKVEEYRKPEFKLEVHPDQPRYSNGQTAKVMVAANYYFGAPATGAKVRYNVYSRTYYPWETAEDTFFERVDEGDYGYDSGYDSLEMQGEAVTDEAGHVTLEIPATLPKSQDVPLDQRFTIELEAVDASRQIVKGRGGFLVTQGDYALNVEPDRYVYQPGAKGKATVRAEDYEGRPISTDVQVALQKVDYVSSDEGKTYQQKLSVLSTEKAKTDAHGRVVVPFSIPSGGGEFRLLSSATDARGHRIETLSWLWVADEEWAGDTSRQGLVRVTFDKKHYRVGEQAKVLIQVPNKEVSPLLTVEGQRLFEARVLGSGKTTYVVTLPVRQEYRPNAFIVATVVDGKAFHRAERSLNINPEAGFLNLEVTPGKARYLPGERASLQVRTTDVKGKPVSAEVALGVVDEAIYALSPDITPDIRQTFLGPRWNDVSTAYSFAEDYSGGPGKDTEEPRIRKNFKDTAAWFPSIRTGPSGVAEVSFDLPDNLTTWVVTARGHTADTKVGDLRTQFLATKDLLVRLAVPRFAVVGDRFALAAIVHNYTDREQPVRLEVSSANLRLERGEPQSFSVPKNGSRRFDYWVEAQAAATASMQVKAYGKGASDALELSFPVLPHGTPERVAFSGIASDGKPADSTVTVPPEALPETVRMDLSFAPTPAAAMLSALEYLRRYPYGCIEQTTSRFVPEIRAYRTVTELGLDQPALVAEMPELVKDGLQRITRMQNADGGWGWFSHDQSELELTSYVLYGLAETRRAGFTIDERVAKRAAEFLTAQGKALDLDYVRPQEVQRKAGPDRLASAVWALQEWQGAPRALKDKLYGYRRYLSNYGMSLAALALADDPERGRALWAELKRRATRSGTQVSWVSDAETYSWYDLDTEATAYALRAALRIEPTAPEIPGAIRWLLATRQGARWISTKDTGAIVIALAEATSRFAQAGIPDAGEVSVDGQTAQVVSFEGAARWTGGSAEVGGDRLKAGRHTVTVRAQGVGELPFSGLLSYVFGQEDIPAKASEQLELKREYYLMDPKAFGESEKAGSAFGRSLSPKILERLPRIQGSVKSQDRVLVRLTVEAKDRLRYMLLEDPLPAGAEVLDEKNGGWWSSQMVRDEKMVFFQNQLATGSTSFYYVMRPQIPGRYHVLPAVIEGMYAPEVRARGAETRLEIRE